MSSAAARNFNMATSPLFNWLPVDPPRRSASRFWLLSAEAPAIAAPAARVPLRKERRFLLFGIAFSFFIISRKSFKFSSTFSASDNRRGKLFGSRNCDVKPRPAFARALIEERRRFRPPDYLVRD